MATLRRHRWFVLAITALTACGLGYAVHWATGTPEGRVRVVSAILEQLSEGIEGSMSVATVTELSLGGHVVAERFVIRDERGDEVISAERATVEFEWLALLDGEVRLSEARAERGRVHVLERHDGELGLDVAFRNTATPSPEERSADEGSEEGGGFVVVLPDIEAIQTVVFIRPSGGPRARIDGVHAHVSVRAAGGRPAVVRFWDASGQTHLVAPISLDAHVSHAEGRFDGSSEERFLASVDGRLADERLEAEVRLRVIDDVARFEVTTRAHGPLGALAGLGIDLIDG